MEKTLNFQSPKKPSQPYRASTKHTKGIKSLNSFRPIKNAAELGSLSNLKIPENDPYMYSLVSEQSIRVPTYLESSRSVEANRRFFTSAAPLEKFTQRDHAILNQTQAHLAYKPNVRRIPSQGRQIIIGHYMNQLETMALQKVPQNLGVVWHHTLSDVSRLEQSMNRNKSRLKPEDEGTMITEGEMRSRDATPDEFDEKNHGNSRVPVFLLKSPKTESFYEGFMKNIEAFTKSLTDFYKSVMNLQTSYQKAQYKQEHLFNFVNTFIQQVEDTGKNLKTLKPITLNICIKSIKSKIDETEEQRELLNEEINQIKELISSSHVTEKLTPRSNNDSISSKRPQTTFHISVGCPKKPGSSRFRSLKSQEDFISNIINNDISQEKEPAKVQFGSLEIDIEQEENFGSTGATGFYSSDYFGQNKRDKSSVKKSILKKKLNKNKKNIVRGSITDMIDSERNEENNKDIVELYQTYRLTIASLENKLLQKLREAKLFDQDDENQSSYSGRTVALQTNYIFEALQHEFKTLTEDLGQKFIVFLQGVLESLEFLARVNDANFIKLTSLKSILEDSNEKFSSIQNFLNQYTYAELTDKDLRKNFTDTYTNLKECLKNDKQTLLYLSGQFSRVITMENLDSTSQVLSQALPELVSQTRSFVKVLYKLQSFQEVHTNYNNRLSKISVVRKRISELRNLLKEYAFSKKDLNAEKFKEAEELLKDISALNGSILSLIHEFETISKLKMIGVLLQEPLKIIKLSHAELAKGSEDINKLIAKITQNIQGNYKILSTNCVGILDGVNNDIHKIISTNQHITFANWKSYVKNFEKIVKQLTKLSPEVNYYASNKYPERVSLSPNPERLKKDVLGCQVKVETLIKVFNTGQLIRKEEVEDYFKGIEGSNLKEKLEGLNEKIQQSSMEKEKLATLMENDFIPIKKIILEVLDVLLHFRGYLKKSFDLESKIAANNEQFYQDSSVNSQILQLKKPKKSISTKDESLFKYKAVIIDLPKLQDLADNKGNLINLFIQKLKKCFVEFCKGLNPYNNEVRVNNPQVQTLDHVFIWLNEMSDQEVSILDEIEKITFESYGNFQLYNQEAKPMIVLNIFIESLRNPKPQVKILLQIKESMEGCVGNIQSFLKNNKLPKNIERIARGYLCLEEAILNSVKVFQELFSIGDILNPKEIENCIGAYLTKEGGEEKLKDYIDKLKEKLIILIARCRTENIYIEREAGKGFEDLLELVEQLCRLFVLANSKYNKLAELVGDIQIRTPASFLEYTNKLHEFMEKFLEEFGVVFGYMAERLTEDTWLLDLLKKFYNNIVKKDRLVFKTLKELSDKIEPFIINFKEEFINQRIKKNLEFKDIARCDPNPYFKTLEELKQIFKTVDWLLGQEEVIYRYQVKRYVAERAEELKVIQALASIFGEVHYFNKEINLKLSHIFTTNDVIQVVGFLKEEEALVTGGIKNLLSAMEQAKSFDHGVITEFDIDVTKLLEENMMHFYLNLLNWCKEMRQRLIALAKFYHAIKINSENQPLFLDQRSLEMIQDLIPKKFKVLDEKFPAIKINYPEITAKADVFLMDLRNTISLTKESMSADLERLSWLNRNVFYSFFFDNLAASKGYEDKILVKINKLVRGIEEKQYDKERLWVTIKEIESLFEVCERVMSELKYSKGFTDYLVDEDDWKEVEKYYTEKFYQQWRMILKRVSQQDFHEENLHALQILNYQDYEEHLEGELRIKMNFKQKKFLKECFNILCE